MTRIKMIVARVAAIASTADGAPVQQGSCSSGAVNQQFTLRYRPQSSLGERPGTERRNPN